MIRTLLRTASFGAVLLAGGAAAQAHTTTTQTTTSQTTTSTYQPATTTYRPAPAVNQADGSLYSPLTGLYVGGYGGYDFARLHGGGGGSVHPDGVQYGGFAGYSLDTLLDRYSGLGLTAAIEGHYGYSNARDHDGGVTVRERNQWGVDFRPGLTFVDQYLPFGLKPYGIFGYDRTKFGASAGGGSGSAHYNGFELGLGTEFLVYDHVGFRADYEHVFYQDNNNVHPSGNELRLGAALHF